MVPSKQQYCSHSYSNVDAVNRATLIQSFIQTVKELQEAFNSSTAQETTMEAALAFIAFLKCEAANSEERAKSLRATAAAIEANTNARKKKRKREGPKNKRGPTGYTLFFQESYENIKKAHSGENVDSKDVLMLIARQWNEIGDDEKEAWQYKAEQLRATQAAEAVVDAASAGAELPIMAEIEEVGLHEPPSLDWNGNKKRPARKNPPKPSTSVDV